MKPLLMMRTRGIAGPRFVNNIKSVGNFIGLGASPPPITGYALSVVLENDGFIKFGMSLETAHQTGFGSIEPNKFEGFVFHQLFSWTVDSSITVGFGVDGGERPVGVDKIRITYNGGVTVDLSWSVDVYIAPDQTFSDYLQNNVGNVVYLGIEVVVPESVTTMTVGGASVITGFRSVNAGSVIGAIAPTKFEALLIYRFTTGNNSNDIQLLLGNNGDEQVRGSITQVSVTYNGGVGLVLDWNGSQYHNVNTAFSNYLKANVGNDVDLILGIS